MQQLPGGVRASSCIQLQTVGVRAACQRKQRLAVGRPHGRQLPPAEQRGCKRPGQWTPCPV